MKKGRKPYFSLCHWGSFTCGWPHPDSFLYRCQQKDGVSAGVHVCLWYSYSDCI